MRILAGPYAERRHSAEWLACTVRTPHLAAQTSSVVGVAHALLIRASESAAVWRLQLKFGQTRADSPVATTKSRLLVTRVLQRGTPLATSLSHEEAGIYCSRHWSPCRALAWAGRRCNDVRCWLS